MLFTPSPPFFLPSESSSVTNDSSPTHISSGRSDVTSANSQSYRIPSSNNSTLVSKREANYGLFSASQLSLSQTSDQECFYSPLSSRSSSHRSIQLITSKHQRRVTFPYENMIISQKKASETTCNNINNNYNHNNQNNKTRHLTEQEDQTSLSSANTPPLSPNSKKHHDPHIGRKVTINVGGVRHRGKLFLREKRNRLF